ncbi:MAG: hypothetical protein K0U98_11635 [Deltaproteobacteria bacterium]|nr:hypothetical protein [Deltaproteobacteria bacterium]
MMNSATMGLVLWILTFFHGTSGSAWAASEATVLEPLEKSGLEFEARPAASPALGGQFRLTTVSTVEPEGADGGSFRLRHIPSNAGSWGREFALRQGLGPMGNSSGASCFCGNSSQIFADGFESGDTSAWSSTAGFEVESRIIGLFIDAKEVP